MMEPGDPVNRDSLHIVKLMTAATADESKSHTRQPVPEDDDKEAPG